MLRRKMKDTKPTDIEHRTFPRLKFRILSKKNVEERTIPYVSENVERNKNKMHK